MSSDLLDVRSLLLPLACVCCLAVVLSCGHSDDPASARGSTVVMAVSDVEALIPDNWDPAPNQAVRSGETAWEHDTAHMCAVASNGQISSCTSTSGSWRIAGGVGDSPNLDAIPDCYMVPQVDRMYLWRT